MSENAFYTKLENRGLVTVSGPDRHVFLQDLITNDIQKLPHVSYLYACLLSPQGKFLYDFFVYEDKEKECLALDCEGEHRTETLASSLERYVLRKDVRIGSKLEQDVFAVFGAEVGRADPRHKDMGRRVYERPEDMPEEPYDAWDQRRIMLAVPDGSRDLIPEHSTPDEGRLEDFNAIDYQKGCYVGQELTARMHYRGLGKKHLYPVRFTGKSYTRGQEIVLKGKPIGEMRSNCQGIGLALIKDEMAQQIEGAGLSLLS